MTQYPGPNYPSQVPAYQSPSTPTAPLRPTSVTVLAIFGIIFGAIGLLCKPAGVLFLFIPQPGPNPAVDMQKDMMAWNIASAVIGTAISVLLLASSIGSLSLKPWARKGMLSYAVLAVIMTIVGGVVTVVWLLPKMQEMQKQIMTQQGGRNAPPPQMMNIMQTAGTVGAVAGIVGALAYPLILGYCYTRPAVKSAFGDASAGGGPARGFGPPPYGGQPYPPPQPGGYYANQAPPPPGSFPPQE